MAADTEVLNLAEGWIFITAILNGDNYSYGRHWLLIATQIRLFSMHYRSLFGSFLKSLLIDNHGDLEDQFTLTEFESYGRRSFAGTSSLCRTVSCVFFFSWIFLFLFCRRLHSSRSLGRPSWMPNQVPVRLVGLWLDSSLVLVSPPIDAGPKPRRPLLHIIRSTSSRTLADEISRVWLWPGWYKIIKETCGWYPITFRDQSGLSSQNKLHEKCSVIVIRWNIRYLAGVHVQRLHH